MRRISWIVLLLFVFAIPWEYSLELGEPLGNIARAIGLTLLLVAVLSVLQNGQMRDPGAMQLAVVVLYLWFCCSYFWTIDPLSTLAKFRGYPQEMMIVWLVWEFADNPTHLRSLLRAWLAGSWILALLTIANLASLEAIASGQIRFAAFGQDPNDVARFLDLGFPIAALLLEGEQRWWGRVLAIGFFPLGVAGVLLTASRGGFVAASVSLVGCAVLLVRNHLRGVLAGALALPLVAGLLWFVTPHDTFERLGTISEQLRRGDLNQRLNIWVAGWHAFTQAPFLGHGAGSFAIASGLAPIDTAHNTALSIAVEGGICALFLFTVIVGLSILSAIATRGTMRIAFITLLAVWTVSSVVGTVGESRSTWLLLAVIACAGRLASEVPSRMTLAFDPVIRALPPDSICCLE